MAERLTDEKKKGIIVDKANGMSLRQIAAKYSVSTYAVRKAVESDKDFAQKITQKKEENTQDMLSFMDGQKGRVQELLASIVEAMDDPQKLARANVRDLATAYGIIVDKYIQIIPPDNSDALAKLDELIAGINHEAER